MHDYLEVTWLPVSGPHGTVGGGDLFEVVMLFVGCFPALFCSCVSNSSLAVGRYCRTSLMLIPQGNPMLKLLYKPFAGFRFATTPIQSVFWLVSFT